MIPSDDVKAYRRTLGLFATGVAVVTALSEQQPIGMTVNSLASVSLQPPLILWSIDERATHYEAFSNSEYFAVHILSMAQRKISDFFSTKALDKFSERSHKQDKRGLPYIDDCLARFECAYETSHKTGDHNIILGRVINYQSSPKELPLLFAKGGYHQLGEALP